MAITRDEDEQDALLGVDEEKRIPRTTTLRLLLLPIPFKYGMA
jgi:hypothetical protein